MESYCLTGLAFGQLLDVGQRLFGHRFKAAEHHLFGKLGRAAQLGLDRKVILVRGPISR